MRGGNLGPNVEQVEKVLSSVEFPLFTNEKGKSWRDQINTTKKKGHV